MQNDRFLGIVMPRRKKEGPEAQVLLEETGLE